MKKWLTLIVASSLSLLLVGCGTTNDRNKSQPPLESDLPAEQEDAQQDTEQDDPGVEKEQKEDDPEPEQLNIENDNVKATEGEEYTGEIAYDEFNLEIEYANQKDYEVKLKVNQDDNMEAKIEDELNGIQIEGPAAYNELYPLIAQLTIIPATSKEEAIAEIMQVFELDHQYKKIEIEIVLTNGAKIEFKDQK